MSRFGAEYCAPDWTCLEQEVDYRPWGPFQPTPFCGKLVSMLFVVKGSLSILSKGLQIHSGNIKNRLLQIDFKPALNKPIKPPLDSRRIDSNARQDLRPIL